MAVAIVAKKAAVADRLAPTVPLYLGSADASSPSSALQGSGIGSMGSGGWWWGRDIKNSQYMGAGREN